MNNSDLQVCASVDNGLGSMIPFSPEGTDRLVLLGACPIDDLIGWTTVSIV